MSLSDWITIVGMVAGAGVAGVFLYRNRERPQVARLVPGAIVTVFAIELLVAFYSWWFEQGSCASRSDLVCVTNENQGVLTMLALIVAATAVWVQVISEHARARRNTRAEHVVSVNALNEGIREMRHNLLHVALSYKNQTMTRVPWAITFQATAAITEPEYRGHINPAVISTLDPLRRNVEAIQRLEQYVEGARWPWQRRRIRQLLANDPRQVQQLVLTSMRFFMQCARRHGNECQIMQMDGFEDFPALLTEDRRARSTWNTFRTSDEEVQRAGPDIRAKKIPVLCWWNDADLGDVTVFELGSRFSDAAVREH